MNKIMQRSHQRQALIFALLVVLAQGIVRVVLVPLWAHYDEPTHYEYLQYLVEHKALPSGTPDQELAARIAASYNAVVSEDCFQLPAEQHCFMPGRQFDEMPGYYVLQAVFQWVLRPAAIKQQVILARIISVLLAVLTAWMAYLAVKVTLPDQPLLATGTALVMGTITGYVDLMSALNNDVAAVAAVTFMILSVCLMLKQGFTRRTIPLLISAIVLCLFAKTSAWIGILLPFVGAGLYLWRKSPRLIRILLIVASGGALLWAVRWEPGVGPLLNPLINQYLPWGGANYRLPFWYDPQNLSYYFSAISWQFVTFWASFSQGVSALPRGILAVFAVLSSLSGLGLLYTAFTAFRSHEKSQQQILLFQVFAIGLALLMSLVRIDPPGGYIPTARHLYVAIVPIVMFFLLGLSAWIPLSWRHCSLGVLVLFLYGLGVWSALSIQLPWFMANWPVGY